jgi:hypothetical protein
MLYLLLQMQSLMFCISICPSRLFITDTIILFQNLSQFSNPELIFIVIKILSINVVNLPICMCV